MKQVRVLLMAMSKETGEVFESMRSIEGKTEIDISEAIDDEMENWWPCDDFIWATFVIDQSFSLEMAYANFAKYADAWLEKNIKRGAA